MELQPKPLKLCHIIIGARIKMTLFELAGMIISLNIYLRASAND